MKEQLPDFRFLAGIAAWLFFGLLALFSASSPEGYAKFGSPYFFTLHQIEFGLLPGLVLFYLTYKVDYHFWLRWAKPLFYFSLLLLILVLIPSVSDGYGAARSWFVFFGLSFQPAELAKLTLILFLAGWLSGLTREDYGNWRRVFLPFLLVLGALGFLIMKQPDMGTLMIVCLIALSVYFSAGTPVIFTLGVIILGLGGVGALILTAPYRLKRLATFLNTQSDVLGAGYHINQALLAVGSGGLWGYGYAHSRQKFQYLPEVSADSIFAVIAEEMGFLVCVAGIFLMGYVFWRGLKIAKGAPDMAGRLIVVGVITWLVGQSAVNIGAMIGLVPLTGVPLPLVSHGGSAMMTMLAALGLVANISKQVKPV